MSASSTSSSTAVSPMSTVFDTFPDNFDNPRLIKVASESSPYRLIRPVLGGFLYDFRGANLNWVGSYSEYLSEGIIPSVIISRQLELISSRMSLMSLAYFSLSVLEYHGRTVDESRPVITIVIPESVPFRIEENLLDPLPVHLHCGTLTWTSTRSYATPLTAHERAARAYPSCGDLVNTLILGRRHSISRFSSPLSLTPGPQVRTRRHSFPQYSHPSTPRTSTPLQAENQTLSQFTLGPLVQNLVSPDSVQFLGIGHIVRDSSNAPLAKDTTFSSKTAVFWPAVQPLQYEIQANLDALKSLKKIRTDQKEMLEKRIQFQVTDEDIMRTQATLNKAIIELIEVDRMLYYTRRSLTNGLKSSLRPIGYIKIAKFGFENVIDNEFPASHSQPLPANTSVPMPPSNSEAGVAARTKQKRLVDVSLIHITDPVLSRAIPADQIQYPNEDFSGSGKLHGGIMASVNSQAAGKIQQKVPLLKSFIGLSNPVNSVLPFTIYGPPTNVIQEYVFLSSSMADTFAKDGASGTAVFSEGLKAVGQVVGRVETQNFALSIVLSIDRQISSIEQIQGSALEVL